MIPESGPVEDIIRRALDEDIGDGDVTTRCTVNASSTISGKFIAKSQGVVAGLAVAKKTFEMLDENIEWRSSVAEGDSVDSGTIVAEVFGSASIILSGERVALNLLQRMSGIATLTRKFVDAVKNTSTVILDTRKTAPGLRILDKWAVRLGGGQNHRFGLYDMALVKDNHITAVGGIGNAVQRVRSNDSAGRPIEVEVKNIQELEQVLELKVDRIMLDNMSEQDMKLAVALTHGRVPLEASGNITLENVGKYAACGVEFVSVGQLTHSSQAMDISLLLDLIEPD